MSLQYTEIKGNILSSTANYICHQVNYIGVMSGDLALEIKKKYPCVFKHYQNICNLSHKNLCPSWFGRAQIVPINDNQSIVNLFSQHGVSSKEKQTDYGAFEEALKDLLSQIKTENFTVAFSKNNNFGLDEGNWGLVRSIILNAFAVYAENNDLNITIEFYEK